MKILNKPFLIFLLLISYQTLGWADVAKVIFATGEVYALDLQNQQRKLKKNDLIQQGDTIITKKGHLQLHFTDGGMISFYDNTEFRITEYQFSQNSKGEEKAFFHFIKGVFRTILGKIKKERYQVKTNIASIGTRGTEYQAKLTDSLQINVFDGIVVIENQSGEFEIPAGRSVLISDNVTLPIFLEIETRGYQKNRHLQQHRESFEDEEHESKERQENERQEPEEKEINLDSANKLSDIKTELRERKREFDAGGNLNGLPTIEDIINGKFPVIDLEN